MHIRRPHYAEYIAFINYLFLGKTKGVHHTSNNLVYERLQIPSATPEGIAFSPVFIVGESGEVFCRKWRLNLFLASCVLFK